MGNICCLKDNQKEEYRIVKRVPEAQRVSETQRKQSQPFKYEENQIQNVEKKQEKKLDSSRFSMSTTVEIKEGDDKNTQESKNTLTKQNTLGNQKCVEKENSLEKQLSLRLTDLTKPTNSRNQIE